jgi:hypothetical protein
MGAKTPLSLIVIIYHNRLTSGVRDMVPHLRCPHERTAYGTCLLHISPESYVGGPLALVQDGDAISLDIPNRKFGSPGVRGRTQEASIPMETKLCHPGSATRTKRAPVSLRR